VDPFRTRAPLWIGLPQATRRSLAKELKAALEEQRKTLSEKLRTYDEDDAITARLHIALLDLRLKWLAGETR
jgi:hypothetical protein